jgi:hypothetical protein
MTRPATIGRAPRGKGLPSTAALFVAYVRAADPEVQAATRRLLFAVAGVCVPAAGASDGELGTWLEAVLTGGEVEFVKGTNRLVRKGRS